MVMVSMVPSELSCDVDLLVLVVSVVTDLARGWLPTKMALPGVPTTALAPIRGTRSPSAQSVAATNSSQLSLRPTST